MGVKITFSERIKQELVNAEYSNESQKAILYSFLSNNLTIKLTSQGETWQVKSQFSFVIRFISNLFSELYDVNKNIMFSEVKKINNRRDYILNISGNFNQIMNDLGMNSKPVEVIKSTNQKRGFLVGAFLSGGSANSADNKQYHLELRSNNVSYLLFIQTILKEFNISMALMTRRNKYVLYIKKSYDISDFLKLMGANNCMLEFEDIKISRDMYTSMLRLNNLDVSNIKKSTIAGNSQIKKILKIKDTEFYKKQSKKFKIFCKIRLENPNASLSEIAKIFKTKYHIDIERTSVNHYVNKLMKA